MSHQDCFDSSQIDHEPSELPIGDDLLQVDLRLGLDEVAAAEEERLRRQRRRMPSSRELVRLANKLYDARRNREAKFSDRLFGEPAWDMLLALYCLPSRGILLGLTSLGHAAHVAAATGEQWGKVLEDRGLIERGPRVSDGRRQLVRLTAEGRNVMSQYLTRLFFCEGPVGTDPHLEIG